MGAIDRISIIERQQSENFTKMYELFQKHLWEDKEDFLPSFGIEVEGFDPTVNLNQIRPLKHDKAVMYSELIMGKARYNGAMSTTQMYQNYFILIAYECFGLHELGDKIQNNQCKYNCKLLKTTKQRTNDNELPKVYQIFTFNNIELLCFSFIAAPQLRIGLLLCGNEGSTITLVENNEQEKLGQIVTQAAP